MHRWRNPSALIFFFNLAPTTTKREATVEFSEELHSIYLSNAGWIWYPMSDTTSYSDIMTVGFRRTLLSPPGKTATNATVLITCDNFFVLFVNGQVVGAVRHVRDIWLQTQKYHLALDATDNVLAVAGMNEMNAVSGDNTPAGLLVAIEVQYDDGSREIATSDSRSWKVANLTDAQPISWDFYRRDLDDSAWPLATVYPLRQNGPWGSINTEQPHEDSDVFFGNAYWLWHSQDDLPVVVFRRRITLSSRTIATIKILIAADSYYELFFDGQFITNSAPVHNSWRYAQRITITPAAAVDPLLAVRVSRDHANSTSDTRMAGMVAMIQILYTDGTMDVTRTEGDGNWRAVPPDFHPLVLAPNVEDDKWPAAAVLGKYGMEPWGNDTFIVDAESASALGLEGPLAEKSTSSGARGMGVLGFPVQVCMSAIALLYFL